MAINKESRSSSRNWNPLFLGFLALAAVACLLSIITGSIVVPETHVGHNMDHSENHPSFDAPGLLRKHNQQHMAQFQHAYHMHHMPVRTDNVPNDNIKNNGMLGVAKREQSQNNNSNKQKTEDQKYHMVFSTSCSPFQNWQALAFFYFAQKVRQPGTVTRLVSGCSEEQTEALQKVHKERVVPLQIPGLQTFEIHFSPNADDSNGGDQKYFNKPTGLLHWMEESLGYDKNKEGNDHPEDDSIIIIVDPDMMLLRPITKDIREKNYAGTWTAGKNDKTVYNGGIVGHGRPHAQRYGYGGSWITALQGRMEEVVGPGSPALSVNLLDGGRNYPAGPPYIATAKDMYQIAVHWVKFLPKYHEIFQGMMCEMHAYSLAAAHLELPHKLANGFMVSDYEAVGIEDFSFIEDKMTLETVCLKPPDLRESEGAVFDPADSSTMTDPAYERDLHIPTRKLPFVLHYCQRYALGRYFFSKYKLPEDSFDNCTAPLMVEPPKDVAVIYDWSIFPNGQEKYDYRPDPNANQHKWFEMNKFSYRIKNGWLLCAAVYGINDAIEHYKRASCGDNPLYYEKSYQFHDPTNFTDSIRDPSCPFRIDKLNSNEEKQKLEEEKKKTEGKISEANEQSRQLSETVEENKIVVKKVVEKISEATLKLSDTPKPPKKLKDKRKVNYMERGQASLSESTASSDGSAGSSTSKPTEGSSDDK